MSAPLYIRTSANRSKEQEYVFDVVFTEFLGIPYELVREERDNVVIGLSSNDQRELIVGHGLFATDASNWLSPTSLPHTPLTTAKFSWGARVPVLFGRPFENAWDVCEPHRVRFGLDIFGSIFFMLTRYEERVLSNRDALDRFPARDSLAHRAGFMNRPLVNEYLEILWNALHHLWPELQRRNRTYDVKLSHDIDLAWSIVDRDWLGMVRSVAGDLLQRRKPEMAVRKVASMVPIKLGEWQRDIYQTFDLLMDENDRHGQRSAFYFIPMRTNHPNDGNYALDDPRLRRTLRHIHNRGHEIGFHPSYCTFGDSRRLRTELLVMRQICEEEGITQESWGGRQHYLRWDNPHTWQAWHDAGLDYDATLGFSEIPGFRCGTCFEYPVFNLDTRRCLPLRERPLIVMDRTLFAHQEMSHNDATLQVAELSRQCRAHHGTFSLLVHNSSLVTTADRRWYRDVLATVC